MSKKAIIIIVSLTIALNSFLTACKGGQGGDLVNKVWTDVHEQCSADPECAQHQLP